MIEKKTNKPTASLWERLQQNHPFPMRILFCLTEQCSLRCGHCYIPDDVSTAELSLQEIVSCLDELKTLGTIGVSFTGGEPTLRSDLVDIVRAAYGQRFWISLKTSGAFLDDNRVSELRDAGLSELVVSLYHSNAKEHDLFVGKKGAFDSAVAGLEQFKFLGGSVRVGCVLMNWNAAEINELTLFCKNRDWPFSIDTRVVQQQDAGCDPCDFRTSDSMLEAFYEDRIVDIFNVPNREKTDFVCKAGRNSAYIRPNGDVWACPILPISFGNIREQSFKDIWLRSNKRQDVLAVTWDAADECRSCEHLNYCERCLGAGILEHGNIKRPAQIDCTATKIRARVAASQSAQAPSVSMTSVFLEKGKKVQINDC